MRIPVVDGLRGVAILGVVWHHLSGEYWNAPIELGMVTLPNNPFLSNGWMGVNLFFFLSGLVLYLPYVNGARTMDTGADVRGFLAHRALRLLPLFYISLIVGFIFLAPLNAPTAWCNFVVGLTFPPYIPAFMPPGNWVLWSLGTEISFCLAMPMLVVLMARLGIGRVAVASLVLALMVRLAGFTLFSPDGGYVNPIADTLFGRIDDFVLGMVAARLMVQRIELSLAVLPLGIAALLAAPILSNLWVAGIVPGWSQAFTYSLINIGLLICSNVLLLRKTSVASLLSLWPLRLAGMMCFSIYAWHGIVLRKFQQLLPMADWLSGGPIWPVAAYAATMALLAAISYVFIEFPGRSLRTLFALERTAAGRIERAVGEAVQTSTISLTSR